MLLLNAKRSIIIIISCFFLCIGLACGHSHDEPDTTVIGDFLVCRQCGTDIALSNFLVDKPSPKAISSFNTTLFNQTVTVQDVENPFGIVFRIITLRRSACARSEEPWSVNYSWFPGYLWKFCFCPKCHGVHLGWMFEPAEIASSNPIFPSEKGFYAIITSKIISEKYVNSLLARERKPHN